MTLHKQSIKKLQAAKQQLHKVKPNSDNHNRLKYEINGNKISALPTKAYHNRTT